jgi:hypothetical protein
MRQKLQAEEAASSRASSSHKREASNMSDSFNTEMKNRASELRIETDEALLEQKRILQEEHAVAISKLQEAHKNAIEMALSKAEESYSSLSLMESTATRVKELSEKIHDDHSATIKVREESFQERERQIFEMQRNVMKQQEDLELEKKKVYELLGSADSILLNVNLRREEDKQELDQAKTRFEKEGEAFSLEKQSLLSLLKQERFEYAKEKDEWIIDKRRFHQSLLEDKSEVDNMQKQLVSKLQAVATLQEELEYAKKREDNQEHAFSTMMTQEMSEIKIKRAELDRDLVALKLEKLKFQLSRSELDAEVSIFSTEKDELLDMVSSTKRMHQQSVNERKSALIFRSEGSTLLEKVERAKLDVRGYYY